MKKVLNLFAGIGGNRKHWKDVEVTAIEYNEEIANVYKNYTQKTMLLLQMHTNTWLNIGENLILYGVAHHAKAIVK